MAKAYHVTARQRSFNALLVALLRRCLPLGPFYLLTAQGRKTGQRYRLPVAPIRHDDEWWLVSPYGEVNWVRNTREARRVMLTRGRVQRTFQLLELAPAESAPLLREHLMRFAMARPSFDVDPRHHWKRSVPRRHVIPFSSSSRLDGGKPIGKQRA